MVERVAVKRYPFFIDHFCSENCISSSDGQHQLEFVGDLPGAPSVATDPYTRGMLQPDLRPKLWTTGRSTERLNWRAPHTSSSVAEDAVQHASRKPSRDDGAFIDMS